LEKDVWGGVRQTISLKSLEISGADPTSDIAQHTPPTPARHPPTPPAYPPLSLLSPSPSIVAAL